MSQPVYMFVPKSKGRTQIFHKMAQDVEMQTQIAAELESANTDLKQIILHKDDVIEQLEKTISEFDAELSEQTDILIKQHQSDGSMKISNYEILLTEHENKNKELTTKLQNKQEECDQLKSEVRKERSRYNENIKQQINHRKMPISNDVDKQKLEQQIEQMKDEIKMLRNNLNTCVCKHRTTSSDTDESNKESIGVLLKNTRMHKLEIRNHRLKRELDNLTLRGLRSENKSKCKTYKDFMDENYPVGGSRKTLMKSAKKVSHKKKDIPDGDDVLYRPPLADYNIGRRRLFMDDFEDLDGELRN